jgi:hypothetical protein
VINVRDRQKERLRQIARMERSAARIARAVRREYRRLTGIIRQQYVERHMVSEEVWTDHADRMRKILGDESARVIEQTARDLGKHLVGNAKGWAKALRAKKDADDEDDEDGHEELALLLLLLAGRAAERWRESHVERVVTTTTETTRTQAAAAIQRHIEIEQELATEMVRRGESVPITQIRQTTARDLGAVLGTVYARRAETIGRTEAGAAASAGQDEAARGVQEARPGVTLTKVWTTRRDDDVRDFDTGAFSHVLADGQEREFDQLFDIPSTFGSEALRYPRDDRGSPGNVIGCRCVVSYETPRA